MLFFYSEWTLNACDDAVERVKRRSAGAQEDTGRTQPQLPDAQWVKGLLRMFCAVLRVAKDGQNAIQTSTERRDWPKHLCSASSKMWPSVPEAKPLTLSLIQFPVDFTLYRITPCHQTTFQRIPQHWTLIPETFFMETITRKKRWGNFVLMFTSLLVNLFISLFISKKALLIIHESASLGPKQIHFTLA